MAKDTRKSLRCPVCQKGRIADIPAAAVMSQYRLFAMGANTSADIIAKCPKCGAQIGIMILYRLAPSVTAVSCGSAKN